VQRREELEILGDHAGIEGVADFVEAPMSIFDCR